MILREGERCVIIGTGEHGQIIGTIHTIAPGYVVNVDTDSEKQILKIVSGTDVEKEIR